MQRFLLIAFFLSVAWCFAVPARAAEMTHTEVCVYGGTSAGVTAAVAAARMKRSVVLVEEGRHLGGLTSGGLGMTDLGAVHTIGGLSREFYERVYQRYTDPAVWTHQRREDFVSWLPKIWGIDGPRMEELKAQFLFEPHIAEGVFNALVREAGVQVVFGERLDLPHGVRKDGARITSLRMESGREFAAQVFVDATYEGDLMAEAGVRCMVGREPNSQYGETLNGIFPFPPAPFPKISPFIVAGDPSSGLLPRIEAKPPGEKGAGDHRVQAYNFRVCLTDVAENRVPFVKPARLWQLYVREARRMISDYVVTEHDAKGATRAEDSICLASYPLDSHGVTLYVDENGELWRERGFYSGSKPFPVSYRALRPRAAECANLLVPCCLSASHAAYGSVRMEPVFMMLGQAAGVAASLAIERQASVQDVPYPALREQLLAQKQILEYATQKAD